MTPKRVRFKARRGGEQFYAVDPKAFGMFFMGGGDRETELEGNVAIVHIEGPLEQKQSWCFDSYEGILARFKAALDDAGAQSVVLKIDSPGGDVDGLMSCVKEMQLAKAASGKPVYAFANELAASAAYALAMAADEVYLPENGGLGSIGVISMLCEQTKKDKRDGYKIEVIATGERKPDGNPHIEVSDGARKRVTKRVNDLGQVFFQLVADTRGISVEEVQGLQADVFFGADAVSKKLADGVMSFTDVLEAAQADGESQPAVTQARSAAKGSNTMSMLALRKTKKDAEAKLAAAKTAAARKKAQAVYTKAVEALATAEASIAAGKMIKKSKKTSETTSEESADDADDSAEDAEDAEDASDDADDDADDSSDDSDDADDADDSADDADDSDDSDDDDDDDSDDSDDGAKKAAKASASLEQSVLRITGKSNIREALGALQGMAMAHKQYAGLAKQVEDLRKSGLRTKVKALVEASIKSGKLPPASRDAFTKIGMRDLKELKGLLDTMPKRVRTEEDGGVREAAQGGGTMTEREREIVQRAGSSELYEKAKTEGKLLSFDKFLGVEN